MEVMCIAYFDSTSCVKNNCRGQSTEYSRAMPSQPSIDISAEVSDWIFESPSEYAFAFGNSTWEDLTVIPGILKVVKEIEKRCYSTELCSV